VNIENNVMDPTLKKRIVLFYLGGVINAFLGIYVLIEGVSFLPVNTATWLIVFFVAFAVVDFWFAYTLKKRWQDAQGRRAAGPEPDTKT
jgi:uncharacterized membrane protein